MMSALELDRIKSKLYQDFHKRHAALYDQNREEYHILQRHYVERELQRLLARDKRLRDPGRERGSA